MSDEGPEDGAEEVILPADKGNATVMMRCDHDGKMERRCWGQAPMGYSIK